MLSGDAAAEQSPIAVLTAEIALLHARLDDLQSRLDR
jgi:polyhydroxyalkanoate synthesis regulator phasin